MNIKIGINDVTVTISYTFVILGDLSSCAMDLLLLRIDYIMIRVRLAIMRLSLPTTDISIIIFRIIIIIIIVKGDLSSCVMDLLLLGVDDIMIRVGLAIMDFLGDKLVFLNDEELQMEFKG